MPVNKSSSPQKTRRCRPFSPPSAFVILQELRYALDVTAKDLGLSRTQERLLQRALKSNKHEKECKKVILKAFRIAEGVTDEEMERPLWLVHHLGWAIHLYQRVTTLLPKSVCINKSEFLRCTIFNLAAPLGASAFRRFYPADLNDSSFLMGQRALALMRVSFDPFPSSSSIRDLPFARLLGAMRRSRWLDSVLRKDSGLRREILRGLSGKNAPSTSVLRGWLKYEKKRLLSHFEEASRIDLEVNLLEYKKLAVQLLDSGMSRERVEKEIQRLKDEFLATHQTRNPEALFDGLGVLACFTAGFQRLLVRARKLLGAREYRILLSDMRYWSHVPWNMKDICSDNTWVHQPEVMKTVYGSIRASEMIIPETKRYLDWLARYGTLQTPAEINDFCETLAGKIIKLSDTDD